MSGLYPTPTRLALLRHVARESVRREYTERIQMELDYNTRTDRKVSGQITEAESAGWVELDRTLFSTGEHGFRVRYWRITDAGRAVLDAHGGA